jgi:hypothetical protein
VSPGDGSGDCETGISKSKRPLWKSRNSHRESATIRNASAFSAESCAVRRMTGPKNALGGPFPVSSHASGNPRLITQSVLEPSVPGSHGIDRSEQTSAESFWDNSHKGEFTNDRMARDDVPDCFRRSCLPPYSNNATGSETGREFWPKKSDFEKKGTFEIPSGHDQRPPTGEWDRLESSTIRFCQDSRRFGVHPESFLADEGNPTP